MYGFDVTIKATMEEAESKVRDALMEEGFGILTEIDVQKVFKAKLDIDRPGYKILGACNPGFAHKAIEAEPDIGLLLPCNVLLQELDNGEVKVGFMDPNAIMNLVDNPVIHEVAPQIREILKRVADSLVS